MGKITFFLGLQVKQKQDEIFISQDKYVAKILRKFGLNDGKLASTPIDTEKPLLKDLDGEDVDVHTYRSMTGSLMYLTSLRPDIMFAVYACARFQVTPKASHLHVVKRIFRYLKGKPHLGLWYPKDSPFNLVAYLDSHYVGASLDKKSITGGYQFLRCRLISWQCKKQTVIATSSTKAEYVAACMSAKRTSWNEFSSFMALAIICLSTGRKFNFSKYIFDSLVRNVDSSSKFYMYLRFLQLMIRDQVSDLSSHTIKYSSPALTQKVFANMRRVGKELSRVETPLFECMIVALQADDVADTVAASVNVDDVPADDVEPTTPPPPPQDLPSTSQVGRQEGSQAKIYHIDLEHADKVLKVVTAATTTISAALISAATITVAPSTEPKPLKKQAQIEHDEAHARELEVELNRNINWDDVIEQVKEKGKQDNVVLSVAFLEKSKEQLDEEASRALKRTSESQKEKAAKKQKLDEEVEELKKHLQILPNDEDNVYTEATPLALKMINNVRSEVKEESEVSLELLRFVRQQQKKDSD
uniref:Uncharacterized protein n=1 Tax=Tanacetum cinerariifolium TaxID=118510 RepID=A0A699I7W4_TANCI|nr:hypothetical protein [Tanacetum cinerariifolium]